MRVLALSRMLFGLNRSLVHNLTYIYNSLPCLLPAAIARTLAVYIVIIQI